MKLIIARWIKKKRKNYTNIWAEFEKKTHKRGENNVGCKYERSVIPSI